MTLSIDKLAPSAVAVANPAPEIFTLDQLVISPLNVRFNEADCAAVEALSASIVAEGLLQSLVVHPVPPKAKWAGKAGYGVLAGGRRYRAIKRAIDAGELPADFPIKATVRDLPAGAIILLSLSENLLRRSLQPYEEERAVARAHEEGLSVGDIALQTGQTKRWVEQRLRLGRLHPDVFAAYASGELAPDQAMAIAATEDGELQREAWLHFRALKAYERTPAAIRAYMKVGDRELARQLLFVGEAVYRGNGGKFELDLFADGPESMRGRVTDEALLAKLVEEKIEVARGQARSAWGLRDLRFQARAPQHMGYDDSTLELVHRDWEKLRIPRRADIADFVATVDIDQEGGWTPRLWWASRKAKAAFERPDTQGAAEAAAPVNESYAARALREGIAEGGALAAPHTSYEAEARKIVRDEHGLTADGINIVRSLRRDLLRTMLVSPPHLAGLSVARHYLTWSGLRIELTGDRAAQTGARGIAGEGWTEGEREPAELLRDQRDGQAGWAIWTDALERCRAHPAFSNDTPAAEALRAFLDADVEFVFLAEAVLAGLSLVRSANTPGWRVPTHDVLAEALGAVPEHLRAAWQPTAAFTGLFGKLPRLAMAEPFVDPSAFKSWHKEKDKPLSAATAAALQGAHGGARGEEAKRWIHPLLAFEIPPIGAVPGVQDAELEPVE